MHFGTQVVVRTLWSCGQNVKAPIISNPLSCGYALPNVEHPLAHMPLEQEGGRAVVEICLPSSSATVATVGI